MPDIEHPTDSYSLAEQWVVEQLNRETFEQHLAAGDQIGVTEMDKCDCIPVTVRTEGFRREGDWRLKSVEQHRRGLMAVYQFDGEQ